VAPGTALGGFGYISSHGSIDDRFSAFDGDGLYLGAFGAWTDGSWTLAGALSYGAASVSTVRNIAFMGRTMRGEAGVSMALVYNIYY
jgi:hypothetical protein